MNTEKRFLVKVRQGRRGESVYPRLTVQERVFGSRVRRVVIGGQADLERTVRPITEQARPAVTLSAFDVVQLIQRELARDAVDRITIIAV